MNIAWYDLIGSIGVISIIVTYLLLQLEKLDSKSFLYSSLNALGAGSIIVSLIYDFNLSAFVIEFFWLSISLIGVFKHMTRTKKLS